jgi:hypothetical protein
MVRWSYSIISMNVPEGRLATVDAEAQMNEHGLEGWELVAVHPRGDQVLLFMKRPEPDLQHVR